VDRLCGTNERKKSPYGNLVRKQEEKRPLGRPTCRQDENNNNNNNNNIFKKYDGRA